MRQSVHALDSYASYIRNNNLQSLQTPNYNLEGDFSVEKYLIAYSEWLSKIIDQYNKFANKYEIGALQQKLAPVFEPDSLHNAISINVLFRMRDEDENSKNLFRIMLVRCSTFKEIVNTPEIVTALFHETAHQFRYETRKKRNDALVKSCTSLWFDIVTKKLIEKIRTEIKWASCEDIFFNKIHISLVDAYLEHVYHRQKDDLLKYDYDHKSFYGFKRDFIDEINSIYNKLDFIDELSEILESIKEKIKFNIDITNKTSRKKIKFLFGLEKELEKPSDNPSKQFINLMKIARKNLKKFVPDEDDVIKRLDGYILHARDIYNLSSSFNANMKKVWEHAYDILTDTSDNKDVKDDSDYSKTHNYFCQNPMGRYLGLDYRHKDNKEEFIKQMSDAFRTVHDQAITEIEQYLTNYREITADMFMCRILELDIFGYYNFIIRNIPISNEISKDIITRLIYVLYIIFDENADNESSCLSALRNKINAGLKILHKSCKKILGEQTFVTVSTALKNMSKAIDDCNNKAVWLFEYAVNHPDQSDIDARRLSAEYSHYANMCLLLSIISDNWEAEIQSLKENKILKEDLENGNEKLSCMKEYLKGLGESGLNNYYEYFAEFWNNPGMCYGGNRNKLQELNAYSIKFIQHMYYDNKFNNAKECYRWGENII